MDKAGTLVAWDILPAIPVDMVASSFAYHHHKLHDVRHYIKHIPDLPRWLPKQ